ncbi:MAG: YggS family pyridoxal phosphate-dependent enzyme [Clostridia bacterium]|nr:YggS family pyridoxal phosphate-dependent enzyme [Clostridia bacterium]
MTTSLFDDRFNAISENLKRIRDDINESAVKSGRRPDDVRLMAVTKTVSVEYINHAITECGIDLIGENKVQEFLSKKDDLKLNGVEKHLIGHLQTNKVKKIVPYVDMIQSVDSYKLAKVISDESIKIGKTMDVLLEVNIGGEESKTGFDKSQFFDSLYEISDLPAINVKGLMTIPPICDSAAEVENYFAMMNDFYNEIKSKDYKNFAFDILSMGMSGDFKEAILHGSNLVRIGSSIFGARIYK